MRLLNVSLSLFLIFIGCNSIESNQGYITNYYSNGKIKSRYPTNEDGNFHGHAVGYDSLGNISFTIEYENGHKNGTMKNFYSDGTLKNKLLYFKDSLMGEQLFYTPDLKLEKYSVIDGFLDVFFVLRVGFEPT